jgi:predicted aminopeptidase
MRRFKNQILHAAIILLILGSGCRMMYILHAASGQFRVIHHSIPIEEALKKKELSQKQQERLRLVAQVKSFGENELGLKKSHNYETVYLESDENPIYTVSASPKDQLTRITWWFPVVGSMPYLGFFDLKKATSEKEKLIQKDLDVVIGKAEAYSTLGWFQDPVTFNLLDGSPVDLVETILHEMTHTTLYVKGEGEFNEGFAMLVGKRGASQFFLKQYGPSNTFTEEAMRRIQDERHFSAFISSLFKELEALYNSPLSYEEKLIGREEIFQKAISSFHQVREQLQTNRFNRFGKVEMNNAYLMAIGLYHRHFHLFEEVLERHDSSIRDIISFFQELHKKKGDMIIGIEEWLKAHHIP